MTGKPLEGVRIGFAITGSFCTFHRIFPQMEKLAEMGAMLTPVFSRIAYETDTRFGKAEEHICRAEAICGRRVIHTVAEAEPIGPGKLLDLMIVAPCTGATLARLAQGVTDTGPAMAVKAHLRNERPVLLAPSTNDGLTGSAVNLGVLLGRRHMFFVPFGQDDPQGRPASLVADMEKIPEAAMAALAGKQIQPMLI